jgi:hypothetical protein
MTELSNTKPSFFSTSIGKEQSKDTGLAMILILLLIGINSGNLIYFKLSVGVLLVVMTVPGIFRPLAVIWFGISHLLGTVMSQILLSLVFILFVVPVAFLRKLAGKDSLRLKEFKKGNGSVLVVRNHRFQPGDFEKPY